MSENRKGLRKAKWVNFGQGENDNYRLWVSNPSTFEGTVFTWKEKVTEQTKSQILVIENEKERLGFNFPIGANDYYYFPLPTIQKGDKVRVSYFGTISNFTNGNVHLVKIEKL